MIFGKIGQRASQIARDGMSVRRLVSLCEKILSERGEGAGASLAREAIDAYQSLEDKQRAKFFQALDREFAPDPARVLAAAKAYSDTRGAAELIALQTAAEPPRQELLRRLNRVPGATRVIVRMRVALLEAMDKDAGLAAVDADFAHLLGSWFNPGFLRIRRVDWRTPAMILEQLIEHEAVHEIRGWDDLRRRLEGDRRCFAFFHPVLPDEPLIFVEVALADGIARAIAPLLDVSSPALSLEQANTAMFYSISNCQPGLRGVSLGNFLIKQVVDLLSAELPGLKRFSTLSPIPGFARWLAQRTLRDDLAVSDADLTARLNSDLNAVRRSLGQGLERMSDLLAKRDEQLKACSAALQRLCAAYLLGLTSDNMPADAVARFHLNNGARVERLNWSADMSQRGVGQSLGLMVNYLYDRKSIEANHERFASRGGVATSGEVRRLLKP